MPSDATRGLDVVCRMRIEAEIDGAAPRVPHPRRPVDPVLFVSDEEVAHSDRNERSAMTTTNTSVTVHDDGTVTLHDRPGGVDGDWRIHETAEGWTADNTVQGFLRSRYNGAFRATFHTRAEVLAALGVQVAS